MKTPARSFQFIKLSINKIPAIETKKDLSVHMYVRLLVSSDSFIYSTVFGCRLNRLRAFSGRKKPSANAKLNWNVNQTRPFYVALNSRYT